jgi:hypothetical protein
VRTRGSARSSAAAERLPLALPQSAGRGRGTNAASSRGCVHLCRLRRRLSQSSRDAYNKLEVGRLLDVKGSAYQSGTGAPDGRRLRLQYAVVAAAARCAALKVDFSAAQRSGIGTLRVWMSPRGCVSGQPRIGDLRDTARLPIITINMMKKPGMAVGRGDRLAGCVLKC